MEKELNISPSDHTPEVNFNAESGNLIMKGRSMPEDIAGFFNPISEWLREYITKPAKETTLQLFFEYYNSSTARRVTEMIFDMEQLLDSGKKAKVIWQHKAGDVVMKENGEEIGSVVDVPFEIEEV